MVRIGVFSISLRKRSLALEKPSSRSISRTWPTYAMQELLDGDYINVYGLEGKYRTRLGDRLLPIAREAWELEELLEETNTDSGKG